MGIISKQKNPGNGQDRTWQYKLHFDVLNRLLEHRKCKTEPSRFNTEQHLRSDHKASDPQQHAAVGEVENGEVDWEAVASQTQTWEQTQISESVKHSPSQIIQPLAPEPQQVQVTGANLRKRGGLSKADLSVGQSVLSIEASPFSLAKCVTRYVDEFEQIDSTSEIDTRPLAKLFYGIVKGFVSCNQ
jgi:hypothetical protein